METREKIISKIVQGQRWGSYPPPYEDSIPEDFTETPYLSLEELGLAKMI